MKYIKSNKGFTLIEMMIAMAIASIVFAAVVLSVNVQQETNAAQSRQLELQSQLRAASYYMSGEIRMAGYDAATMLAPEPTIRSIGDSSKLTLEYNLDSSITESWEPPSQRMTFQLSGTDLVKTSLDWTEDTANPGHPLRDINNQIIWTEASSIPIANNISDLSFQYLQNDGVTAATNSNNLVLVRINITATVDNDIVYGGGISRSMSTDVTIKNMLEF